MAYPCLLSCLMGLLSVTVIFIEVLGREPTFDVPLVNVTAVAGRTVILPCSITSLGKYKVVWLYQCLIPITYEDRRVIDDYRFTLVRPYITEWNLQIQDVTWEDQGQYTCDVNTDPVRSKIIMLHVKTPAQIVDELSSDDVLVQEGGTVILVCYVTGVPKPEVKWYRRPANKEITKHQTNFCQPQSFGPVAEDNKGEMMIISNVSRHCDDVYECVADNGIPPAISRQMRVTVEFPPEIKMTTSRLGQYIGKQTILECQITAFPHAVTYWEKDSVRITSSVKYRIEAYDEGDNTITLSLRIHNLEESDYGEYKCVAANTLGRNKKTTWLYQLEPVIKKELPTPQVTYVSLRWISAPGLTYEPTCKNQIKRNP